jgi:hypothetical protein
MFKRIVLAAVLLMPILASATEGAVEGSSANTIGRIIGFGIFAFLVLKFLNRNK